MSLLRFNSMGALDRLTSAVDYSKRVTHDQSRNRMGKGDRKTKKGKVFRHSYGKSRKHKSRKPAYKGERTK